MIDREKIIDKIKKLFRLSTSPNEHEAALALQRAIELMEKYDVDASEVRDERFQKRVHVAGTTYYEYEIYIVSLIEVFFHVKMVHITKQKWMSNRVYKLATGKDWVNKYDVYGKDHHIAIAEFVFTFLCRTFAALWRKNRRNLVSRRMQRKRRKQVMLNYFVGVYSGLYGKLSDAREKHQQQYALVHLKDDALEQFVLNQPGISREDSKKMRLDIKARAAGYLDGQNINVNKTLTSAGGPVKLLREAS